MNLDYITYSASIILITIVAKLIFGRNGFEHMEISRESHTPTKVLIIQGEIPHYRAAFFDQLALCKEIELMVAHCGSPVNSDGSYFFQERILKKYVMKGFVWQSGLLKLARDNDVVIGMFDLRWLGILLTTLICSKKSILWGHGFGI